MLNKLRARAQDEKGFTLIELLVVILIIGILAAIALPAFLNQREKAQDSEAKTSVRTAQTAMETFYTDNQTYVGDEGPARRHRAPRCRARRRLTLAVTSGHDAYASRVTSKRQHDHHHQAPTVGVARSCTRTSPARAAAPPRRTGSQLAKSFASREAGLRARFVVNGRSGASKRRSRHVAGACRY